jgi:hypothetical protein
MDTFARIIGGAPWWVFPLLGLLVWLGVQRLKPRVIAPARLLVTPAIFLSWGLSGLVAKPLPFSLLVTVWLAGVTLGALPGAAAAPIDAMWVDRQQNRLFVPGGWATLVIGVSEFMVRYALAVSAAIQPDWRSPVALTEVVASGLAAGYFLGWIIRIALAYRRLPDADFAAAVRLQ